MSHSKDWITLAGYSADAAEGEWSFPVGELVPGPEGMKAAQDTHLVLVLPAPGLLGVRVELVVGGEPGQVVVEASKYHVSLGLGNDTACRLHASGWPLAVRGRCTGAASGDRTIALERGGGRVSATLDGNTVLEGDDPLPREAVHDVFLFLNQGAVLRSARVQGCPAPAGGQASAGQSKRREQGFALYNCIDFYDDLIRSPWTEKTFRSAMQAYRRFGVKRLYFVYHYGADGGFWDQSGRDAEYPGFQANINRTISEVGDFLPAAVRYAREVDLPVFAVLKPYESALFGTFPEGSEQAQRFGKIPRLGGPIWWSPHFVAQNPHLRIERDMSSVPSDLARRRVESLLLTAEPGAEAALDPARIRLWVSPDNGTYRPYDGPMSVRSEAGAARRIALEGLRMDEKHFVLTVEGAPTFSFGNVRRHLLEARDERGERLPLSFCARPRMRGRDWREVGFMVDVPLSGGQGAMDDYAWLDGEVPLGAAVGLERYLQGALCFAFPETRAWMLRQVDRCVEAGVEGVDFRIVNHNRTHEWEAYGFNPPIVDEYRRRHGTDILREPFDREKWRRLRGECYAAFLREAVARLRAAGKAAHLHVSPRMGDPAWHTEMEIHFDWPGWMREGLADEITLKMGFMRRHAAPAVIAAAREAGLPVNFCPVLNGLPGNPNGPGILQWMLREAKEGGADGFVMYENAAFMGGKAGGEAELTQPWIIETVSRQAAR